MASRKEEKVRAMQEELDRITARRTELRDELEEVNDRAKELTVALLKAGVPRADLIGRPYTSAYLTQIQATAGLARRQKRENPK